MWSIDSNSLNYFFPKPLSFTNWSWYKFFLEVLFTKVAEMKASSIFAYNGFDVRRSVLLMA